MTHRNFLPLTWKETDLKVEALQGIPQDVLKKHQLKFLKHIADGEALLLSTRENWEGRTIESALAAEMSTAEEMLVVLRKAVLLMQSQIKEDMQ